MRILRELLIAVQFLTRIPVPRYRFVPEEMPGAAKWFPLVGEMVGLGAVGLHWLLRPHLPGGIVAMAVIVYLALVTGGLHEDGLADTADGLGAGGPRERMLAVMRDSRIGSFGTVAIVLSVLLRWGLLSAMEPAKFAGYVLAAQVLSRWSALPLSVALPSAREGGLGSKFASSISAASLIAGSVLALAIVGFTLRTHALAPVAAVAAVTLLSGLLYRSKLGGITGDCMGATIQISEIAVYLCAVWA